MRKNYRLLFFTFIILMALPTPSFCGNKTLKSLYKTLDSLIVAQPNITEAKEERIRFLGETLNRKDISDDSRYQIYNRLYDEYLAFRFDSAYKYVMQSIELQKRTGNEAQLQACHLRLSHILSVAGLFDKAGQLLGEIDPSKLDKENLLEYYNAKQEYFLFLSEQADATPYFQEYQDSAIRYRQKIMDFKPADAYVRVFTEATYIAEKGNIDKAITMLEGYLPHEKVSRRYSILTNTLAYFNWKKGNHEGQEEYLLRSAINDVKNAIRENNSLRELAKLLLDKGDTKHAFFYLNVSNEDANFYGSKLRKSQVATVVPQITMAYKEAQDKARHREWILTGALTVIALLLLIGRIRRSRLIKKLKQADSDNKKANDLLSDTNSRLALLNNQLNTANDELMHTSRVKDEYLGRFFELGSTFIMKADERNKKLNRLARDRKLEELYKELKSYEFINMLSESFFKQFDNAFLNICPNFVDDVNNLLAEGNKFEIRGDTLTTELRILALIRLGITGNQKIADILNSSITTIYTYRSKMKARAKNRDTFETDVEVIGY